MIELKSCPFCGGEAAVFCERKVKLLYAVSMPILPSNVVSVAKSAEFIFGRTV